MAFNKSQIARPVHNLVDTRLNKQYRDEQRGKECGQVFCELGGEEHP
jgi:hypothetical protein